MNRFIQNIPLILLFGISFFSNTKASEQLSNPLTGSQVVVPDLYTGPIPPPEVGYGSLGSKTVKVVDFSNPTYDGQKCEFFFPEGMKKKVPTIFFSHGFGAEKSSNYRSMIHFMVSKGFNVVFVPFPSDRKKYKTKDLYEILWNGFVEATKRFNSNIDLKKVGFVGHSFGGGASFSLSYKAFVEEKWGEKGRFIFTMGQWYSHDLPNWKLKGIPKDTKLIVQVFEDDETNDHRMAIDIFKKFPAINNDKDFVIVPSSKFKNISYISDHNVPVSGGKEGSKQLNALDYYAIYRPIDAMTDLVFNRNWSARGVALGNGSAEQVLMPMLDGVPMSPLVVSSSPRPFQPESSFLFKCSFQNNPRKKQCPEDEYSETENSEVTLEFQGEQRRALLKVPRKLIGQKLPLVVLLHGGGGNAERVRYETKFDQFAEEKGIAVLYPQGTGKSSSFTWNAGNCCGDAVTNSVDDIGFIKNLLLETYSRTKIRKDQIFALGFSNGGMMSYKLGAELSDIFTAVGSVGGKQDPSLLNAVPAQFPVPGIIISG